MIEGSPLALVTGGSRGIGRGICYRLARAGFSIVINYITNTVAAEECRKLLLESATSPQPRFEMFQADVSMARDRAKLVDFIEGEFGWVDVVVNNAGVAPEVRADLLTATEESFDRLISINLKGPYFLTQAIANFWISKLAELPASRPRPKVINISSISAYAPSTNRGDYCVSKAGLSMATKLYAARLAEYGINVYEIRPGIVETDMTERVHEEYDRMISGGLTPIARWGKPKDVGRAVETIAMDRFPFSTGEVINVDGGFHLRRL